MFACRYALTHSDGSSLLKTGDRAATIRGDRNVRTRASDKGRYCRAPYRLETAPNPKHPLKSSSHFLHEIKTLRGRIGRALYSAIEHVWESAAVMIYQEKKYEEAHTVCDPGCRASMPYTSKVA